MRNTFHIIFIVLLLGFQCERVMATEEENPRLSDVYVEDIYVGDDGSVAFGIKVFGPIYSPDGGKIVKSGFTNIPSRSVLESLCVTRLDGEGNASTNLRFQIVGNDSQKNASLNLLLQSKIANQPVAFDYEASEDFVIGFVDPRYKQCEGGLIGLSTVEVVEE